MRDNQGGGEPVRLFFGRVKYNPKLQIPFLLSLLLLSVAIAVVAQTRSISEAKARQLVLKFMRSDGYDTSSPNFSLEEIKDPYFPDFYEFEARVDNPDRDDAAGDYFVDPRTADVQEFVLCQPPKAKTVIDFQAQLRKSIGLSDSEYRQVKKPLPCSNK